MIAHLAAFLALAGVLVAIPGPSVMLAGAAYLIYLGCRLLLARRPHLDPLRPPVVAPAHSSPRAFGEGLLCELSNPKTLVVFTSFIPQFLSHHAAAGDVAAYGVLFALLGFASLSVYVVVLGATHRAVRRHGGLADLLLRASGGLLALFGVSLLVDRSA